MTDDANKAVRVEQIRAVRLGHGANCSSIGSVIDTLFVGALVGGAILAAVAAALASEPITVVGRDPGPQDDDGRGKKKTSKTGGAQ